MLETPKYLGPTEACKMLGISRATFYRYKDLPPADAYFDDRPGWKKDTLTDWWERRPHTAGRPSIKNKMQTI